MSAPTPVALKIPGGNGGARSSMGGARSPMGLHIFAPPVAGSPSAGEPATGMGTLSGVSPAFLGASTGRLSTPGRPGVGAGDASNVASPGHNGKHITSQEKQHAKTFESLMSGQLGSTTAASICSELDMSAWGDLDTATGFMEKKSRLLGSMRYKPVTESQVQQVSFHLKQPWTMIEREAARRAVGLPPPAPKGAEDPEHPLSFPARLDHAVVGLQIRGLDISISATVTPNRWAQLHTLEKRLEAAEEREFRARHYAHIATSELRVDVMKNYRTERAKKALIRAAREGDIESALKAIDLGAPSDFVFHNGETILTTLVHMRATTDILRAVRAGSNPQKPNANGWTPLMLAIALDSEPTVAALLTAGVNPNLGRWFGVSNALAGSPAPPRGGGNTSCGTTSPWHGAPLGREGDYLTPAMYAVALGVGGCVGAIFNARGIDFHIKNNKGRSLLHYAARFRRLDSIRLLCHSRIDPDVLDICGFAPVDWLRAAARERIVLVASGRACPGDDDGVLTSDPTSNQVSTSGLGDVVNAITGRITLSFVETCMLEALEEAAKRHMNHEQGDSLKSMKVLGIKANNGVDTKFKEKMFNIALKSTRMHFNTLVMTLRGADETTMASMGKIVRGMGDVTSGGLLALLETPRPDSALGADSLNNRRREQRESDDEDDEVAKLPRVAGEIKTAAMRTAALDKDAKIARSAILPDYHDFPVIHILSEKPSTDKLGDQVRHIAKTARVKVAGYEASTDPNEYPSIITKASQAGQGTVMRAMPPDFLLSPASGRAMAVSAIPTTMLARLSGVKPLVLARDRGLVGRGLTPFIGFPLAVRERNALTMLVEGIMAPIITLFRVRTDFNFLSPEAEVVRDFVDPPDALSTKAAVLEQMRGVLVLYHKQTLARLGELAAPVVLRDMNNSDPELLGDFGPSTDPCNHCQERRAVVRCINCAAAHCERCTLWIHKQAEFRAHRCRPLLPKGLSEGLLMTRQARAEMSAADTKLRLESFPKYVERLRKVLRRVKARIVAAKAADDEIDNPKGGFWSSMKSMGPGAISGEVEGGSPEGNGAGDKMMKTIGGLSLMDAFAPLDALPPAYNMDKPQPVNTSAPGDGLAAVRSSRVAAYNAWINSVPGSRVASEPLPPVRAPQNVSLQQEAPYEPPPLVLGKLLQMNPNIGKWMGITLTPLFAPAPEGLPKPPDAPEFAAKTLEIIERREGGAGVGAHAHAHAHAHAYAHAAEGASTAMATEPHIPHFGSTATAVSATASVSSVASTYFEKHAELPTALEAPDMVYLRPKADGSGGFQTREDRDTVVANLAVAKAATLAKNVALNEARWEAMLAAKKGAVKAGKSGREANEIARAAAEIVSPVITEPIVEPSAEQIAAIDGTHAFDEAVKEGRAFSDQDPRTAHLRKSAEIERDKAAFMKKYFTAKVVVSPEKSVRSAGGGGAAKRGGGSRGSSSVSSSDRTVGGDQLRRGFGSRVRPPLFPSEIPP